MNKTGVCYFVVVLLVSVLVSMSVHNITHTLCLMQPYGLGGPSVPFPMFIAVAFSRWPNAFVVAALVGIAVSLRARTRMPLAIHVAFAILAIEAVLLIATIAASLTVFDQPGMLKVSTEL